MKELLLIQLIFRFNFYVKLKNFLKFFYLLKKEISDIKI